MARKGQTNPSRNKTTARTKPSATSSSARQSATVKDQLNAGANKASASAQSSPSSPEEVGNGTVTQKAAPQGSRGTNGIDELQQQMAALKKQFETVQSNYIALQQTATEQANAIDTLQGQLEQRKLEQIAQQDQCNTLQNKTVEQADIIQQLQEQIGCLNRQVEHVSEQPVQMQSNPAPQQDSMTTANADALNNVHQQVATLRAEFDHQVMEQMTQQQRYEVLRRQCDEQAKLIAELRSLVVQEQRYAAIGEAHLNKWRYRTFSS